MKRVPALLLLGSLLSLASAAPPHAILIDGPPSGDHDWRLQTPVLKAILESNQLFQVEAVTAPLQGGDANAFQPAFDKYKLVILNYDGDGWPSSARAALDKYLMSGGGVLALPAAETAFPEWPEFNTMLGLTGGANRGKSAGPLWFYKEGNLAYDNTTEGPAGKVLPADKPFPVTIRYTEHPVTKGLPLTWMHLPDELVGNLRGPANIRNMTLLATALSAEEKGGTGRDEPQFVVVAYGKGRIFHSLLGRTVDALDCAGLQVMLQRGAEWAATGKVTQKIPADFPSEEKTSARKRK